MDFSKLKPLSTVDNREKKIPAKWTRDDVKLLSFLKGKGLRKKVIKSSYGQYLSSNYTEGQIGSKLKKVAVPEEDDDEVEIVKKIAKKKKKKKCGSQVYSRSPRTPASRYGGSGLSSVQQYVGKSLYPFTPVRKRKKKKSGSSSGGRMNDESDDEEEDDDEDEIEEDFFDYGEENEYAEEDDRYGQQKRFQEQIFPSTNFDKIEDIVDLGEFPLLHDPIHDPAADVLALKIAPVRGETSVRVFPDRKTIEVETKMAGIESKADLPEAIREKFTTKDARLIQSSRKQLKRKLSALYELKINPDIKNLDKYVHDGHWWVCIEYVSEYEPTPKKIKLDDEVITF